MLGMPRLQTGHSYFASARPKNLCFISSVELINHFGNLEIISS